MEGNRLFPDCPCLAEVPLCQSAYFGHLLDRRRLIGCYHPPAFCYRDAQLAGGLVPRSATHRTRLAERRATMKQVNAKMNLNSHWTTPSPHELRWARASLPA